MNQLEDTVTHIDLGASIGKAQAFAALAHKSAAAQAAAFREIRDAQTYKLTGLPWEEFCPRYIGLTRPAVDRMIRNLEEFGQTYFRLSEIAHVSPTIYRQMKRYIDGDAIDLDGQRLTIAPENAARIREAVHLLRANLPRKPPGSHERLTLDEIRARFDALSMEIEVSIGWVLNDDDREMWSRALQNSIDRLAAFMRQVSPFGLP